MPGGLGKSKIVAALAEENLNEQLKQAGANIIGEQDIIKKVCNIISNFLYFNKKKSFME